MDSNGLRELVVRLRTSASALSVLALALDAATGGERLDPVLAARVDEVLDALGAGDAVRAAGPAERMLVAETKALWQLDTKLVTGEGRRLGWHHTEFDLLETFGTLTVPFAHGLKNALAPRLPGLVERLEAPGAAFLDVGCGVGALAIEFARLWPGMRVVGLDVWAQSLGLARDNVARSGLGDRIELREQAGQDLTDVEAYDIAWIPTPFIPEDGPVQIARKAFDALRPGGWLLYAVARAAPDPLVGALGRLRVATYGGRPTTEAESVAVLGGLGYTEVQVLPGPPTAPASVIAARRPVRA